MEIDDDLGNLYRAALMIGKGNIRMGRIMLSKAGRYSKNIGGYDDNRLWAEKILDEYYRLRWGSK